MAIYARWYSILPRFLKVLYFRELVIEQTIGNRPFKQEYLKDNFVAINRPSLGDNRPLCTLTGQVVATDRPFVTPSRPYPLVPPTDHGCHWQTILDSQQTIPSCATNRPLLPLADHLLISTDHILLCRQQTIVATGRPFVTPSRPYPLVPLTDHCCHWQTIC